MGWIPLQQRFRVGTSALEFLSERPRSEGRWRKRRWRTNRRHLFRYCDATLHVRDFRRIAALAEAVVRCMWPEKAQAMMKELYDDGFQRPGRSTLLRALE